MTQKHFYMDRDKKTFWRSAVTDAGLYGMSDIWKPKLRIRKNTKVITAGSCFAQNISSRLVKRGYTWLDCEPSPGDGTIDIDRTFNYGIFSFRTGNIYTTRMLRQWVEFAFGVATPNIPPMERDGRFYDPYRQQIEPDGFESAEEMLASREAVFAAIRKAFIEADVLVFTFGLTEAWQDPQTGQEYSMCPGVIAGTYSNDTARFVNHDYTAIIKDFRAAMRIINAHRKTRIRALLTVSPVPLTSTATDDHVLVATTHSKSILRAVAGHFAAFQPYDYFPSYEIITAPISRGSHYASNMRNVTQTGVDSVLAHFFDAIAPFSKGRSQAGRDGGAADASADQDDDVKCDEVVLEAFANG